MRLSAPGSWLIRFWVVVSSVLIVGAAALGIAGAPEGYVPPPLMVAPAPVAAAPVKQAAPVRDAAPAKAEPGKSPRGPEPAVESAKPRATAPAPPAEVAAAEPVKPPLPPAPPPPGRETPGPIADPDPALLSTPGFGQAVPLPKVAADGRAPMQLYASAFDRSNSRPRVAVLVAGIGQSEAESELALKSLPPAFSVAMSPYTPHPERYLNVARLSRHEVLLSVPMESTGSTGNEAGERALKTTLTIEENRARLTWDMTRFAGYVGVTNALGAVRGDKFAASATAMRPVLAMMAQRGLFWLDARPGAPPAAGAWSRSADLVVDDSLTAPDIDSRLSQLEQIARDKGSAVGLVTAPRGLTVGRLITWAIAASERGVAIAPVSAVMRWTEPAPPPMLDQVRAAR